MNVFVLLDPLPRTLELEECYSLGSSPHRLKTEDYIFIGIRPTSRLPSFYKTTTVMNRMPPKINC